MENDGQWCRELYQAKAAELILYGRALGLSHSEAEDLVQETFVSLMQRDARPKEPLHYCLRTFRNRALNYRRNLWRRLRREFEFSRWFERSGEQTQQEDQAMAALPELPREQREVIVLKIWHELTFQQIGVLLEISPNTAAGRYRYGLENLRKRLSECDYERMENIAREYALLETAPPLAEN